MRAKLVTELPTPPRAERWSLPLFFDDRLERLDVERLLGDDLL